MTEVIASESHLVGPFWTAQRIISSAAGLLLIVAALLKAASPSEIAVATAIFKVPASIDLLIVWGEIVMGLLLIGRFGGRRIYLCGSILFAAFAAVALYRGIAGYDSCGCFGALTVSPWLTLTVDVALAVLLGWAARQPSTVAPRHSSDYLTLKLMTLLLCGIAGWLYARSAPQELASMAGVEELDGLVILEPEEWIGQELPISKYLEPTIETSRGQWVLLLYHHDCPDCQVALPRYIELAASQQRQGDKVQVLLIEVPPLGSTVDHSPAIDAHLATSNEWFVQAPVEVRVTDGLVTEALKPDHGG